MKATGRWLSPVVLGNHRQVAISTQRNSQGNDLVVLMIPIMNLWVIQSRVHEPATSRTVATKEKKLVHRWPTFGQGFRIGRLIAEHGNRMFLLSGLMTSRDRFACNLINIVVQCTKMWTDSPEFAFHGFPVRSRKPDAPEFCAQRRDFPLKLLNSFVWTEEAHGGCFLRVGNSRHVCTRSK